MAIVAVVLASAATALLPQRTAVHAHVNAPQLARRHLILTMSDNSVDVSNLDIVMADLEKPLDLAGDAEIATFGVESTSCVADDGGVKWSETSTLMSADISIPGLMGQPAEVSSMLARLVVLRQR